jgi:hypothetical protein
MRGIVLQNRHDKDKARKIGKVQYGLETEVPVLDRRQLTDARRSSERGGIGGALVWLQLRDCVLHNGALCPGTSPLLEKSCKIAAESASGNAVVLVYL